MEANNLNLDQTARSLIWVHIVCNLGYLRTEAYGRADDKSCDWVKLGATYFKLYLRHLYLHERLQNKINFLKLHMLGNFS